MVVALPAVVVSVLWIAGWVWRFRHGLAQQASSRGQLVGFWAMVASVPIMAAILLVSISATS